MIRAFAYPLCPNVRQIIWLDSALWRCRTLYNAALEQRITAWKQQRKSVRRYDQQKQLTELRASDPAWRALSVEIERSALLRLDLAYAAFFRRVKIGETAGFPRFKSRDRYDSFSFSKPVIRHDRVLIPGYGPIRFHRYRQIPPGAVVRDAKIRRTKTGQWVVCFAVRLAMPTLALARGGEPTRAVGHLRADRVGRTGCGMLVVVGR